MLWLAVCTEKWAESFQALTCRIFISYHCSVNSVCLSQLEMCRIDWMHKHIESQPEQVEKSLWIAIFICENKYADKYKCSNSPTVPVALFPRFNCGCSWSHNNQDSQRSSRTDSLCLHFCTLYIWQHGTVCKMFSILSKLNERRMKLSAAVAESWYYIWKLVIW